MNVDVVGFTAMMAENAQRTLGALIACFELIERAVTRFGGRVIDTPGDNLLAEFTSEFTALQCAMEVQRDLLTSRVSPQESPMVVRIGLHSGDVLDRGGRLYGDPINVSARLQAAAEPGAILLSEAIAERALSLEPRLEPIGPRRYKNVPYEVATYRARP
jgi:adenylate cyclase